MMLFFLFLVFGLLSCTSSQIYWQYHFINIRKNWTEAQSFCRAMYTDLATVNNRDEMNSLLNNISDVSQDMYIGLYRSQVFKWHWSLTDGFFNGSDSVFENWKPGISDGNHEGCAVMQNSGQWINDSCDSKRQFVCFNATASKKYILIEESKSWREAQEYCRTFHTDLACPRDSSENQDVKNIGKKEVWIGLFKDSWSWSDRSNTSFRFWNSSVSKGQDCASVMVNQSGRWNEVPCNVSLPFKCHGDLKSQPTTEPVTLPADGQNLNTSSSALSSSPPATQHIPPQNTTERQNTYTQPTQTLQTFTINTTVAEQDSLILVYENLTWMEAVSYCRKHHVDLVSIHSQEPQDRTARKATQASTSYVWMGLRYTCDFNFWFWINNRETGCYQNWAPGHGPHGFEQCGLSGAMESTGEHRWVGRPGSEKLNFICYTCANSCASDVTIENKNTGCV
ncbi:macrophage mannose receptor 1 [Triplophysa rosa]|uniref:macrophage mannose receptor 1 n=1 Tax=Triplophysa rosa TaxID=992332 RepID=UPI0025460CD9|nr:macrophage mannose receptor 1 [Triplophysa rosa]XP_057195117.1 macrophage mannose receptor 1 [Triplophysa rosa]